MYTLFVILRYDDYVHFQLALYNTSDNMIYRLVIIKLLTKYTAYKYQMKVF